MSRFIDVHELAAGDRIRHAGADDTVASVERSPDRYHWRVRLVVDGLIIVPPGARFTRVLTPEAIAAATAKANATTALAFPEMDANIVGFAADGAPEFGPLDDACRAELASIAGGRP